MRKFLPAFLTRRTTLLVVFVLIVFAGFFFWKSRSHHQPQFMTAPVTRSTIEDTVLASGTLKPMKLVAVGAQVSGRIVNVHVALGDTVRKGALIAEIDSNTQQNNLKTAQATLAQQRAQRQEKQSTLMLAEQTLARQKVMVAKDAISRADYDNAVAQVDIIRAQIAALDAQIIQAQVSVDTARVNLGYTRITAPIDGTVLAIVSQEGQTVNANQAAPTIVVMGQLDTMLIKAEISEADVVRVKAGQPVNFTILGDTQKRYRASLESIEPAPASITSDSSLSTSANAAASSSTTSAIYYNGIFHVPNEGQQLRTYMTAEITIVTGQAKDVLSIPASALQKRVRDGYLVRVLDKHGAIETKKVKIGLNNKIMAEVTAGLEEGEQVIIGEANGSSAAPGGRPGMPGMGGGRPPRAS